MNKRQYYFVKEHLKNLPAYFFISQLDSPLADDNPMTLGRAMMAQAPSNQATGRLIRNVDASWNQATETVHLDLPYQSYYFGTFLVQPIFD
jgi:hypothetical protein